MYFLGLTPLVFSLSAVLSDPLLAVEYGQAVLDDDQEPDQYPQRRREDNSREG